MKRLVLTLLVSASLLTLGACGVKDDPLPVSSEETANSV
jgi:predicted small lipoprotein YifL